MSSNANHARTTLILCMVLHGLTHAYGTMLVPLYLLMVADLRLGGVRAASLIVTIYGLVYCLGSYGAGVLADRFNRKSILGIGLIGNALAIGAMGLTRQYEMLLVLAVLAGAFGTLFHPAANALVPSHYPQNPGQAIGYLGMGSGLGFFFGPQFAGWRAESAGWHWGLIADWQRPCIEMAGIGLVTAVIFLIFARESRPKTAPTDAGDEDAMLPNRASVEAIVTDIRGPHGVHPPLTSSIRKRILVIALTLGWRDFAGIASITLMSVFLQKAHGYSPKQAGFTVGAMMLLSILVNPLAVYFSAGRRRLPGLALVLLASAVGICFVPLLAVAWILPVMCVFQTVQLGSYAISDAAILERVSPVIRGRVVGLFLTLAGTIASLAPWLMGLWTDLLKDRARDTIAYLPIFITLAVMLVVSMLSVPIISHLSNPLPAPKPEPSPA